MSTHFHDYDSVEGHWVACGRYYEKGKPCGRGVAITTQTGNVSCQTCLGSERFRIARARVSPPLDAPIPGRADIPDDSVTDPRTIGWIK